MTRQRRNRLGRRAFMGAAAAGGVAGAGFLGGLSQSRAAPAADDDGIKDRKLLFVVCASGGASIVDSFLPVTTADVGDDALANTLNVYRNDQMFSPPGSDLRCVRPMGGFDPFTSNYDMPSFLEHHAQDVAVMTQQCTSVNHTVAQKRAITGAGANRGRTIMEAMAERHGAGLLLPNCNMASGGYIEQGDDAEVPGWARSEVIVTPTLYAAAMDGTRGVTNAPPPELVQRARSTREKLEDVSRFGYTFSGSALRQQYLETRRDLVPRLESEELIHKLMMLPEDDLPPEFGLQSSPRVEELRKAFPNYLKDPWEAQAGLGFLLAFYGVSCSVTLGLDFDPTFLGDEIISTPLAFDYSHNNHRAAQNIMWARVCRVLDGMIFALKATDYMGDPSLGKMWDRSLIYVATDFGREKIRPSGSSSWGTGHHLNNGTLLVSPLLNGNRVYGGVDPKTMLTYGFDRVTGEPAPGTLMREADVYGVIAQTLGIEYTGRKDSPAMVRGA